MNKTYTKIYYCIIWIVVKNLSDVYLKIFLIFGNILTVNNFNYKIFKFLFVVEKKEGKKSLPFLNILIYGINFSLLSVRA